jgi:hypothetical protein
MAGGYPTESPEPLAPLISQIQNLLERVRRLETPTGTSISNLVAQVQAALVGIDQKVQDSISANSYTKAQIDAKIASPGAISPTSVQASGNIGAQGTLAANGTISTGQSVSAQNLIIGVGSHGFNVTTNYVAAWINGDGTFGTSASSIDVKRDLVDMPGSVVDRLLALGTYQGRYTWDPDDAPLKSFLLAEQVQAAGLGDDVVATITTDAGDDLLVLNHALLIPVLVAALKAQDARLRALEK